MAAEPEPAVEDIPQNVCSGAEGKSSLRMMASAYYLPKENSDNNPLGQGAHFICDEQQTFGLADGVRGPDSGVYAGNFIQSAVGLVQEKPKGGVNPKQVIQEAFLQNKGVEGSITATIITLEDDSLRALNMGDSGFRIIRDGKIVHESTTRLRGFKRPIRRRNPTGTLPPPAQEIAFNVKPGDVVVAATVGLFDNVPAEDIELMIMTSFLDEDTPPDLAAERLAKMARSVSSDRKNSVNGGGYGYVKIRGDKYDNVTVIVAYLYEPDASPMEIEESDITS
ncbi:OLC1v1021488C1 [Oldenlandia corymbosa var. corymbosa]|uniref:Protein phosphatase n=1 Tax=Oldenlandia corymbosa var. corymbosa TaxID=529605 RepID=A0AAV1BZA8_OLDCO|nr:OLC1v1021488C1 [Oldenlandia corymbosa var. corymbosa]